METLAKIEDFLSWKLLIIWIRIKRYFFKKFPRLTVPFFQTIVRNNEIKEARYLSKRETGQCELLGEAHGQDFDHCLYLGMMHCTKFFEKLYGYRYVGRSKSNIKVAFYKILP